MTELLTPDMADYRARCFVNGVRRHGKSGKMEPASGEFHERFLSHPWVRESIAEGWGKELRSHLVRVCKIRLMRGETLGDITVLMPDKDWVASEKHHAERYRLAAEWRARQGGPSIDAEALLRRFGIAKP